MMSTSDPRHFPADYVEYWKKRVTTAADGTQPAETTVIEYYLSLMGVQPSETIADIGCGHGRLFPVLASVTPVVVGIDITDAALAAASAYPYAALVRGRAEETNLGSSSVHHAVMWAVFDITDQTAALVEMRRILRTGGTLMVTGKNRRYRRDDDLAFVAERNARLKRFPNHFTDLGRLLAAPGVFGFSTIAAFAFERRGHLGQNISRNLLLESVEEFYEYVLVLRKLESRVEVDDLPVLGSAFSEEAMHRAGAADEATVDAFFDADAKRTGYTL